LPKALNCLNLRIGMTWCYLCIVYLNSLLFSNRKIYVLIADSFQNLPEQKVDAKTLETIFAQFDILKLKSSQQS